MSTKNKIVSVEELKKKLKQLKSEGKTIAFTNGCFDILTAGHVDYLEKAKKDDRILIVGLNSDASVRKLKGNERPIVKQDMRAAVLAALACVDFVVLFNEDTPQKLIAELKPDVLIKGGDYKGKEIVGSKEVIENGGRVEIIPITVNTSTSDIIKIVQSKSK